MSAGEPAFSAEPTVRLAADRTRSLRDGPRVLAAGSAAGSLAGALTVVKDLFDIEGTRTGAGNPRWLEQAEPAVRHAAAVSRLVEAGATVIGKAHTDELAFSLAGTNVHYGTPLNPAAPDRTPGGSSSGSASAVAAGYVPFALGTDTGGSLRIPASYCGVLGLRTTHGRIPVDGLVPLAPVFDTVGVLAATGAELDRSARALLLSERVKPATHLVIASDLFALGTSRTGDAVHDAVEEFAGTTGLPSSTADFARGRLAAWRAGFLAVQLASIWRQHGEWVTTSGAKFGPGVAARFKLAAASEPAGIDALPRLRDEVRAALDEIVPRHGVLVFPTAPGPAPRLDATVAEKDELRLANLSLTCIASLGGFPALSLPLATVDGLPVGVSFVARPGDDELLLDLAVRAGSRR